MIANTIRRLGSWTQALHKKYNEFVSVATEPSTNHSFSEETHLEVNAVEFPKTGTVNLNWYSTVIDIDSLRLSNVVFQ